MNRWLQIKPKFEALYDRVNRRTGGIPEILRAAVVNFDRAQCLEAGAAIAYYLLFSMIPLLLLLISAIGFLLNETHAVEIVLELVHEVIPVSLANLEPILQQVVATRNVSSLVGLVGLVLAASGVFTTLARNVNRAWPQAGRINPLRARLFAVAMMIALVLLIILWLVWKGVLSFLAAVDFTQLSSLLPQALQVGQNPSLLARLSGLFPWVAAFLLLMLIYRWLPNVSVRWSAAAWAALVAGLALALLARGFGWFVRSGFTNYETLYGSLGALLAFLTWVFLSANLVLFGAHLSAAITSSPQTDPSERTV